MYWLIGLLVLVIFVMYTLLVIMYMALECKEGVIATQTNEYRKLLSKYEHVLVQAGEEGFEVRVSYSDTCHIKLKKVKDLED